MAASSSFYSRETSKKIAREIHENLWTPLQKPWPILLLASVFLMAPVLSFVTSVSVVDPKSWLQLESLGSWISRMTLHSWLWSFGVFSSGILLMFQRRWTWTVAIALIVASAVYQAVLISPLTNYSLTFKIFSLVLVASGAGILYFFRFPYIDRRDSWWGMAKRYVVRFPATIQGSIGRYEVQNISKTGALIAGDFTHSRFHQGQRIVVVIDSSMIHATVVRVETNSLGMMFDSKSRATVKSVLDLVVNT